MNESALKQCSKCKQEKQVSEFYWHKAYGTYHSYCKECAAEYGKSRYARNPRKFAVKTVAKTYQVSAAEAEELVDARSKGACAICSRVATLHIDHDHATGKIRSLLCPPCNKALGLLRDSPEIAQKAADYLRAHA
jgi:hypothetical protein